MKKTFKAAAAFLLILAVAIGMCACSGGAGGKAPGKKIAIVTATLSQNPEEYQRAAQLASEYSYVEHVVYTDTRVGTSGILDFYKRVNDIASDASYGAIVIARANLGAVAVQPTEADMERLDALVSAYDNVTYADDTDGGDLPY